AGSAWNPRDRHSDMDSKATRSCTRVDLHRTTRVASHKCCPRTVAAKRPRKRGSSLVIGDSIGVDCARAGSKWAIDCATGWWRLYGNDLVACRLTSASVRNDQVKRKAGCGGVGRNIDGHTGSGCSTTESDVRMWAGE